MDDSHRGLAVLAVALTAISLVAYADRGLGPGGQRLTKPSPSSSSSSSSASSSGVSGKAVLNQCADGSYVPANMSCPRPSGASSSGSRSSSGSAGASPAYEPSVPGVERERQGQEQEAQERLQREAEAERVRQEQARLESERRARFERDRQDALGTLKMPDFDGALRGSGPGSGEGALQLKSATESTDAPAPPASMDPSVVDLRDRKTDILDPARVRGPTRPPKGLSIREVPTPVESANEKMVREAIILAWEELVRGTTTEPKSPLSKEDEARRRKLVSLLDRWDKRYGEAQKRARVEARCPHYDPNDAECRAAMRDERRAYDALTRALEREYAKLFK